MWVWGAIGQGPLAGHAPGSHTQALSTKLATCSQAHALSLLPRLPPSPWVIVRARPAFRMESHRPYCQADPPSPSEGGATWGTS